MAISERVNTVTAIFGFNENSGGTGKSKNSAIPGEFDSLFHGDNRQSWPSSRSSALGTKTLEEYDRTFPNYRVKNGFNVTLETSGNSVASHSVSYDRNLAPITLEGGPGEFNPFRADFGTIDGSDNFLPANEKGKFQTKKEVGPIDGVEGVRVSAILGGNDTYLIKAKQLLNLALGRLFGGLIPAVLETYYRELPAFYTFVDFIFMADGTKVVRVWDASAYPAQSLYVGNSRVGSTPFREGIEWTREGADLNGAFRKFVDDSGYPDRTPFRILSELNYANAYKEGSGNHPVLPFQRSGSKLDGLTIRDRFPTPLVPPLQ